MKKEPLIFFFGVLFVSLFALFLSSLSDYQSKSSNSDLSEYQKYLQYKTISFSNGVVKDTILLDYTFNMTDAKVNRHTNKLIRAGKLKKDNRGVYYELSLRNKIKRAYIYFDYFEKKLSELALKIDKDAFLSELTLIDVRDIYDNIYGYNSEKKNEVKRFFIENDINDMHDSYFLWGNLEIHIYMNYYDEVYVKYTDLRVEQIKKNRALEKEKKQQQDL